MTFDAEKIAREYVTAAQAACDPNCHGRCVKCPTQEIHEQVVAALTQARKEAVEECATIAKEMHEIADEKREMNARAGASIAMATKAEIVKAVRRLERADTEYYRALLAKE